MTACGGSPTETAGRSQPPSAEPSEPTTPDVAPALVLNFAACPWARDPYESKIIPAFESAWRKAHGQVVRVEATYDGGSAQAQAIQRGYEADVAALSIPEDIDSLVRAGFVSAGWRSRPHGGMVTSTIVVMAVRKGNPQAIREWSDLLRPGLRVVTPDPRDSDSGRCNVSALYGVAWRGRAGFPPHDEGRTEDFLARVFHNVVRQEADSFASCRAFAAGTGDVAIASECQIIRGRMFGNDYDLVIPSSTMRIDNPAALVSANADKHGVRELAQAYLDFLLEPETQRAFSFHGMRPVHPDVIRQYSQQFPVPADVWTVDDLGGWDRVSKAVLGPDGVVERAHAVGAAR